MSNENDPKKPSTADILAKARAQAAQKAAAEATSADSAPEAPAVETPAAKPAAGGAPKSTSDILAAARAQAAAKAAGGEAPAAEAKPAAQPAAAKPAAGGAPKSTSDILAAARAAAAAKAGGGAAAESAAKPAAAAKVTATASGDAPKASVSEMLAAVRGEKPAEPKAAPAVPPMPQKPVPAASKAKKGAEERRSFIAVVTSAFALGWIGLGGALSAGVLGVLRFMMPNVLTEPPSKFKVGSVSDFDLGTVSEKFKASNGIWIVHTDKYQGQNLIYALSTVCTHLGCTPSWLEGEQKFKCPCHGSGFYINGVNFEGPAPRPLERVGIRIAEDGMLEVDKSVKFQEEMGQWSDPASFVQV